MKQKFSNSQELHEFFLCELLNIVGFGGAIHTPGRLFTYHIIPGGNKGCLGQPTLRKLFIFFTKYELHYYINFELGCLSAYTNRNEQKKLGRL